MDTDLIAPETETDFQEIQQREHIRPPAMFKGQELLPFSRGSRLLYGMALDDNDLVIYRVLAFIYIHTHPRDEVIPLLWSKDGIICAGCGKKVSAGITHFREKILELRDTLTDEDEAEAHRIVNELIEADTATRVIAEPENSAGDGKKNEDVI